MMSQVEKFTRGLGEGSGKHAEALTICYKIIFRGSTDGQRCLRLSLMSRVLSLAQSDDLNSTPGAYMVEGENEHL